MFLTCVISGKFSTNCTTCIKKVHLHQTLRPQTRITSDNIVLFPFTGSGELHRHGNKGNILDYTTYHIGSAVTPAPSSSPDEGKVFN